MNPITVDELFNLCKSMKSRGLGNRKILLSSDDDGNEFRTMYYAFTYADDTLQQFAKQGLFRDNNDPKEIIVLG